MPADRGIHVSNCQLRQLLFQVRVVIGNAIVPAVEGVTKPRTLRLRQDICVFGEEFPRRFERLAGKSIANELVVFV